eukprot:scaffold10125_cov71-Phaeocystis_antarctica.AAC.4
MRARAQLDEELEALVELRSRQQLSALDCTARIRLVDAELVASLPSDATAQRATAARVPGSPYTMLPHAENARASSIEVSTCDRSSLGSASIRGTGFVCVSKASSVSPRRDTSLVLDRVVGIFPADTHDRRAPQRVVALVLTSGKREAASVQNTFVVYHPSTFRTAADALKAPRPCPDGGLKDREDVASPALPEESRGEAQREPEDRSARARPEDLRPDQQHPHRPLHAEEASQCARSSALHTQPPCCPSAARSPLTASVPPRQACT